MDCHVHVFDPLRFPYARDTGYVPRPAETGTPALLAQVLDAHHVKHALLVGPNSGYGLDNRCLLDTLKQGGGRYKGIAVVPLSRCKTLCGGADRILHTPSLGVGVGLAISAGPSPNRLRAAPAFAERVAARCD